MSNFYLKPSTINFEGAKVTAIVRDPETFIPLASEGEWKPRTPFWVRRLRDGDAYKATPQTPPRAKAPKADAPAD